MANQRIWDTALKYYTALKGLAGAAYVSLYTKIAGERTPTSTNGADYLAVSNEGDVASVVYSDGDTTIWPGPALLYGYRVTTNMSAHAWTIDDDTTAKLTIPASTTAGAPVTLPCPVAFNTSLVANVGASASAGVIEFFFRPMGEEVSWNE